MEATAHVSHSRCCGVVKHQSQIERCSYRVERQIWGLADEMMRALKEGLDRAGILGPQTFGSLVTTS